MMKEDHPAVFDAMGSVPAQYAGYSSDGRIYGADPLVAGLLTCGATGHDALTFPDDWGFEERANAPLSFLGGDELLSLHGDYWLYALAASEIKRKYSRAGSDNGNSREREFPGTLGNSRVQLFTPGERDLGKQAKPGSYSGRGRRVLYYGQDLAKPMPQAHVLRS